MALRSTCFAAALSLTGYKRTDFQFIIRKGIVRIPFLLKVRSLKTGRNLSFNTYGQQSLLKYVLTAIFIFT
jgi:hypothetical protein